MVKETGGIVGYEDRIAEFKEFQRFIGMDDVLALERRFLPADQLKRKFHEGAEEIMNESANAYPLGLRVAAGRNAALRGAVESGKIVVAPGAFDCLTARLVERAGSAR